MNLLTQFFMILETALTDQGFVEGLRGLGAGIGAGIAVLTGLGSGIGQGLSAGLAAQGVARQPEAVGAIRSTMIVGQAVAETAGIYGLIVAILLMFVFA